MLIHSADISLFHKHLRLELEAIKKATTCQQGSFSAQSTVTI
jgi:hypothetical protein